MDVQGISRAIISILVRLLTHPLRKVMTVIPPPPFFVIVAGGLLAVFNRGMPLHITPIW
jgi:hypothetical protein